MILQQFYLDCLAQASYLIADEETRVACVVDPRRDVEEYLEFARANDLSIRHCLLTHIHADFLAGHLELAAACEATIHVGEGAGTQYEANPLREGDELVLGPRARLRILSTPGHTPESICILLFEDGASQPSTVLTGDTMFAGEVGRPDLLVSRGLSAEELAGMMYDSLHEKLLKLDDEVRVYPGHGAGSACGKNISSESKTTIGYQRQWNWACADMDRDEFVRRLTSDLPSPPAYFVHDATRNRERRETLDQVLEDALAPLAFASLDAHEGVQIVDTREPEEFAAGHVVGSINIGLDGMFANWAGSLLDAERPIAILSHPERQRESATRLGRIGFDHIIGVLPLADAPLEIRQERLDAGAFQAAARNDDSVVLDVRRPAEWLDGRVEGSLNIPLQELQRRIDEVPRDKPLLVYCKGGYRSMIASSILRAHGFDQLRDLRGGYDSIRAKSSPTSA